LEIYPLLQKAAFEPEDIKRLVAAYEEALRVLQLSDRDDPITQIIGERIIKAAQTGIREPSEEQIKCVLGIERGVTSGLELDDQRAVLGNDLLPTCDVLSCQR